MSKAKDCFIVVGYENCHNSDFKHKNGKLYTRDGAISEAMSTSSELDNGSHIKVLRHDLITDRVEEIYTRSINA